MGWTGCRYETSADRVRDCFGYSVVASTKLFVVANHAADLHLGPDGFVVDCLTIVDLAVVDSANYFSVGPVVVMTYFESADYFSVDFFAAVIFYPLKLYCILHQRIQAFLAVHPHSLR